MAERRMFAKTITDSDAFLDMPLSSQCLYFHLAMRADDDGFINNPRKIQRMIGSNDDDLRLLLAKNFLIPFENGIVVIKHWKIHNYIRGDRYKATVYQEELSRLDIKDNGVYTPVTDCTTIGIPTDNQAVANRVTQVSIGKDRLGKDRLGKDRLGKDSAASCIPESFEDDFDDSIPVMKPAQVYVPNDSNSRIEKIRKLYVSMSLPNGNTLTLNMHPEDRKKCKNAVTSFTDEEIIESLQNYEKIVHNADEYDFDIKYQYQSFPAFMDKGVGMYSNAMKPLEKKSRGKSVKTEKTPTDFSEYDKLMRKS